MNQLDNPPLSTLEICAERLGSQSYKKDHQLRFAYVAGSMYKGIASANMVIAMGKSGMLGYLGTGGMRHDVIEENILKIKSELHQGQSFGLNLLCNLLQPDLERKTVELFLKHKIERIEASAFTQPTQWLILYRAKGLYKKNDGSIANRHWIMAKISRPEVAEQFLKPCPEQVLLELKEKNFLSDEEVEMAKNYPIADDICVESDSGGHTDQGIALVLLPSIIRLKNNIAEQYRYQKEIRVGAAGGLGTPEAFAAMFMMGADFVLSGSINQCTVEACVSETVKDMLSQAQVQDTAIAPAGDMFEVGAKVRVLSKGVFFPARAQKLYDLYRQYNSWEEIDEKTRGQIEKRFFKKSFEYVWEETKNYYIKRDPEVLERANKNPKSKLALVFRWYFVKSTRAAQQGNTDDKVDYQIQCGPALGAFNLWVKGSNLENWRNRHVDEIGKKLMHETADYLSNQVKRLSKQF